MKTNSNYKLEILPIAKKEMDDIIFYISNNLNNKTAADNLSKCFIESLNQILFFPYGLPEIKTLNNLSYIYRKFKVKNYLIFYTIYEYEKKIVIVRVLYQKKDYNYYLE